MVSSLLYICSHRTTLIYLPACWSLEQAEGHHEPGHAGDASGIDCNAQQAVSLDVAGTSGAASEANGQERKQEE